MDHFLTGQFLPAKHVLNFVKVFFSCFKNVIVLIGSCRIGSILLMWNSLVAVSCGYGTCFAVRACDRLPPNEIHGSYGPLSDTL